MWALAHNYSRLKMNNSNEFEEYRKDAERYRWLRKNSASFSWQPARYNSEIVDGLSAFGTRYIGYNFEDAINLAIQQKTKKIKS